MARVWMVAGVALVVMASVATAVPVTPVAPPARTPDQWEYCEIQFRQTAARVLGGGAAQPARVAPATSARFVTADEEIEVATWAELADKVNAKPGKKDASESVHKMRVFNHLGSQGWELVAHQQPTTNTAQGVYLWTFRKKVSK